MISKPQNIDNTPIDAVITWVDGDDPTLTAKRNIYLSQEQNSTNHQGALATRFASNNEIRYCILSIFKFAAFVRNVYIVTDGQDPNIWDDVRAHFPERLNCIRIVDHKEIFGGYEEYLPTFNSTAIESMLWRIEGISENFVYFNDDVFLIRKVKPEDWVKSGRPVLMGKWLFPPFKKLISYKIKTFFNKNLRGDANYQLPLSFNLRQWNAAKILGYRFRYFSHYHVPHILSRNTLTNFFAKNSTILENNISYRFRSEKQYITISLANHLEIQLGNKNFAKTNLVYLFIALHSKKRVSRRIKRCEKDTTIKSVCLQSLDMASKEDLNKIYAWVENFLGIHTKL